MRVCTELIDEKNETLMAMVGLAPMGIDYSCFKDDPAAEVVQPWLVEGGDALAGVAVREADAMEESSRVDYIMDGLPRVQN